jgi:hypothetical protein
MQDADAKSRRGIGTRRKGEEGENNAKLNNSSTGQHFDVGFQTKIAITFLLFIALTNMPISFWRRWQAKTASHIVRAEPIKGSPSKQRASVDYTRFKRQHLCEEQCIKNEVGHSNTRGIVSLCYFPAEILLHIVYISNILCGLEVIDSRRLQ